MFVAYNKIVYKNVILENISEIHLQTLDDNSLDDIMMHLNAIVSIDNELGITNESILVMWNEIVSDAISCVYLATSGFYHPAIVVLRSILELGCTSLFFYDHKIECHFYKEFDALSDYYVSTLVTHHNFFTTRYIKAFYSDIDKIQTNENSVSSNLKLLYGTLSDSVHGRYKSLTKTTSFNIAYQKSHYKSFQDIYCDVLGMLILLYSLRFNKLDEYKDILFKRKEVNF